MKKPVYVIDAMNYIFRAYHALPDSIIAPSGMLTNAILGYMRTILRIVKEQKPEYLAIAFESDSSFRNQLFAQYKATRVATPENLEKQLAFCRRITEASGIVCFDYAGYEADDIMGTVAARMTEHGHPVVIVTGDKDMSQLCGTVRIYDIAKEVWLDETGVFEKFGVRPQQIPDLLALLGDSVDNIPGVMGVGEKTARQILSCCEGLEHLLATPQLGGKMTFRNRDEILRRIHEGAEKVRLSLKLATICCDVPIEVTPETVFYRRGDKALLDPLCDELGFRRLLADIPLAQPRLF